MTARTTIWVLLALFLCASVSISAQKSSLTVTGTVTEVKVSPRLVRVLIDKNNEFGEFRWERDERMEPVFSVFLRLQFCNKDNATLIIPTVDSLRRGDIKFLFLELPAQDSPISATGNLHTSGSTKQIIDPIPTLMKEFEKPEPSKFSFAVVEPGTCYDATDVILLRSGYKAQILLRAEKRQQPIEIAIPEHSQFKIQYSLPMKDSLPVSEAKRRWSHIGKLLTTSDGDFFFETDVIMKKLAE